MSISIVYVTKVEGNQIVLSYSGTPLVCWIVGKFAAESLSVDPF